MPAVRSGGVRLEPRRTIMFTTTGRRGGDRVLHVAEKLARLAKMEPGERESRIKLPPVTAFSAERFQ